MNEKNFKNQRNSSGKYFASHINNQHRIQSLAEIPASRLHQK